LFGSIVAASLPRFTATCPAKPGLTVGSTLDGGPNWADDANRVLVACEVDRCVVIALMQQKHANGAFGSPIRIPISDIDLFLLHTTDNYRPLNPQQLAAPDIRYAPPTVNV
jgi:hypothetical protein